MEVVILILGLIVAYLVGSIPTAIWLGKARYGIDIREHGSGNAGATNTFRVLGKKAGVIVMAIDILKGFIATSIPYFIVRNFHDKVALTDNETIFALIIFGIAAVIGHIFPIYERFKGGKGVATLLGMALALNTPAALICVGVFLFVLLLSKYVSLASMIASLAFPIMMLAKDDKNIVMIVFGFVVFALVVFTHKKNIKRILQGEENKSYLGLRKNKD